jgi:hypothetical protein
MSHVDAYSELETDGLAPGEKPWCDMVFDLIDSQVKGRKGWFGKDGRAVAGVAMATTPNGDIGFQFEAAPVSSWDRREDDGFVSNWGQVTLRTIGEPTDRLLREYERWFEEPVRDCPAIPEIGCLTVLLNAEPEDLLNEKVHAKLFFDPSIFFPGEDQPREADYAELFFNLDLKRGRAWLREKDPGYRSPLLRWLSGAYLAAGERA